MFSSTNVEHANDFKTRQNSLLLYLNKTGFLELKHATFDFYINMYSINVHTYYDVADPQLNHVETENIQFCIRYKDFEL